MTNIIIANIICAIAYLIMIGYTFLNVKRSTILIANIIISILYGIEYILLKAYSGAFISLFGIFMYTLFYFKGKNKILSTLITPIICFIGYIIIGILTWDNIYSIFPTICGLIAVVSMWLNKELYIKGFNIPISILWIIYNVIYKAYVGIIGQSVLFIFDIIFIVMYYKKYRFEGKQ